jgi:hypothetical protein
VLAGRERSLAFPAEAFQVEKVVHKNWFALEQVEAVAPLTAAERIDHAFCTSLRNFDLGGDGERLARNVGGVAVGKTGRFTRVGEDGPTGG